MDACDCSPSFLTVDQRCYFVLQEDIQPTTDLVFTTKVDEIENELKIVEEKQRKIASDVYSYSVPIMEVFEKHKIWVVKLSEINARLSRCALETEMLHKGLPFLESLSVVSLCIGRIHCLELKLEATQVGVDQLILLLQSDTYTKAVVLYKNIIEICEGEKFQIESACKNIFKCLGEQEKTLDDLPNLLTRQIKRVHRELREFYDYALGSQMVPQAGCTQEKLLEDEITDKLSTLNLNGFDQITYRLHLESLLTGRKKENISLRDDLCMRSGLWGIENELTKICNLDIKPCLNDLEEIAKELQKVELSILSQLRDLYEDNGTSLVQKEIVVAKIVSEIEIRSNELQIEGVRKSLYELISTKQIRVGLYYAARLSAFIEEVRFIADHFSTDTNPENKRVVTALKSTFGFMSIFEANNRSQIEKIQALFFTAGHIAFALHKSQGISKFNGRIINCLYTLVARVGKKIFEEIKKDDDVWLSIVNGSYINHTDDEELQELRQRFVSYMQQEITEWFYFSNKPTHIKLDMIVYTVTHDHFMSEFLQYVCNEDPQFAHIYKAYQYTSALPVIVHLCTLFRALRTCTLDVVFTMQSVTDCYSTSQSLITKIDEVMDQIPHNQEIKELIAFAKQQLQAAKNDFKWLQ